MSGSRAIWEGSFETLSPASASAGADEGLDALRTICAHAAGLDDALMLAAMCGLTAARHRAPSGGETA